MELTNTNRSRAYPKYNGHTFYTMLSSFEGIHSLYRSSDDGEEDTPVPIPNTEVKLFCADGSWDLVPVRVGRR